MKNKEAQVSLFMILAVFILATGYLYFVLREEDTNKVQQEIMDNSYVQSLNSFIDSCTKIVAKDGIYFIALQGGYYDAPLLSENYSAVMIPYYWHYENNKMPKKEIIEVELSTYIKDNLNACLDNLKAFEELGLKVKTGNINVESTINAKDITINLNYPIEAEASGTVFKLENFIINLDFNFNKKYELVKRFMGEQEKYPNSIPLGFISDLGFNNNFSLENINLGEGKVLYALIFDQYEEEPFIYSFFAQYNWDEAIEDFKAVIIEPIPEFNLTRRGFFNYRIKAAGDDLTFYDYTDVFNIGHKNGAINFDTYGLTNGRKNILIRAIDDNGNDDFAFLVLNVNYSSILPQIEPIGNLTAYTNQKFTYKVKARDPAGKFLLFSDGTSLFDINVQTGEIEFVPESEGNYSIPIIAVNSEGSAVAYMDLQIK